MKVSLGGHGRRTRTRRQRRIGLFLVVGLVAPLLALTGVAPAGALQPSVFVVDSAADAPDASPGDGACASAGDECTLRAAIEEANATTGAQVVVPGGTITLTGGELDITSPMTIIGAREPLAPAATVVDAAGASRVFDVAATGVTIDGLTATGGDTNQTGGGIRVGASASLTLVDSVVSNNTAREGGGVANEGTLTISRSTISANAASRKGGGILNDGVGTIGNTTIVGNSASQGGGFSGPGQTVITQATVVRNVAGSSSSAGLSRNGGVLQVSYSIIAENFRSGGSEARDCSGTPDLTGLNLVSIAQGCNPVDPLIVDLVPALGALADNGGPTPTIELLEFDSGGEPSQSIDAFAPTGGACPLPTDQRGTLRPIGAGCDLGAFERAPLALSFSLGVDTSAYPDDPSTPDPEVEVGVTSIPTERILPALVARGEDPSSSGPADTALRSIGLRSIEIQELGLRSIDPEAAALRSIALRSIGLRSIALRSIALRSIGLRSIALRSILLSDIPLLTGGGWEEFLASNPELAGFVGLPLQSITLEDLVQASTNPEAALPDSLTLEDISLESTALRSIALRSILLAGAALRSIPIPDANGDLVTDPGALEAEWCALLGELCGGGDGQIPAAELGGLDLLDVQLAGGDVDVVPMFDIPLDSLASTALRSIGLRSIALRSIKISQTALRSIGLRSIALRSIDDFGDLRLLEPIVDCAANPSLCSTAPSNTFVLGDVSDAQLIGDIGSIADLPPDLLEGISLGDLLLAFVAAEGPAWESFDLEGALLQNLPDAADRQPTFDYIATVNVTGGPGDLDFTVTLPPGFAVARGDGDPPATFDGVAIAPADASLGQAHYVVSGVGSGVHELVIPARAGLTTGEGFVAVGQVVGTAGSVVATPPADTAVVNVVEAFEDDSNAAPVPLLQNGEMQLAHISRSGDTDLYAFVVPEELDGSSARVRLSNIPAGVDYDLTLYAAPVPSLRNAPTRSLASIGDIGFDLDPVNDVYATDVVDDIALDVPGSRGLGDFTVRDISTRRSGEDEEVRSGPLVGGDTYYVAVTSYLGALSAQPYGMRLQIGDDVQLPDCAAPRVLPGGSPTAQPAIPAGVNTLYITNTQWLAAQVGDTSGILAAIDATAGVNGVVPALVPVDDYTAVAEAYAEWVADRCNPDARNAVVSAIGSVIDGIIAANPTVENLVIVGDDGVVPMAAVPDLVEFANERTFALEVVRNDENNEVAAALGAGLLLTDDPYATNAGISVQEGDHELFLPDLSIGRLVETGPQILAQLTNFVTFNGRLDPSTVPGASQALVTGYDFLSDGASAVAAELAASSTVTELNNPTWDRLDFLAAYEGDYALISPNAHYDFESLLPAAADGTFFDSGDLVHTTDLVGNRLPQETVVFSMGCHAGLSISDVQLGFASQDWAETYASTGNNILAAHTTYGFGDTEIVAFSERLTAIFAGNVSALINGDPGAPVSVGEAMVDAKQEYLATTLVLNAYDEKILQSMTFYGLPMYTVGEGGGGAAAAAAAAPGPSPVTYGTPDAAGVTPVTISLNETVGTSGSTNLNLVSTSVGDYYEVGGNTVSAQYRAVQPLVEDRIPSGVGTAAGFLITEITTDEILGFDSFFLNPTLDSSANESRLAPFDGSFPARLQRIATESDGEQRLLVAAGQYQGGLLDGANVQRLFPSIEGDLYPAVGDQTTGPPTMLNVISRVGESEAVVQFEVTTDSSATRVYALFKEGDPGGTVAWTGVDLFRVSGTDTWLGAAPIAVAGPDARVESFFQAVGSNGQVAVTNNKVDNFLAALPDEEGTLDIGLDGDGPVNGYFRGDVTATVTGSTNPGTLEISVDSAPFVPGATVVVSGEGGHVVLARDDDGGREFIFLVIDSIGPNVATDVFPASDPAANGPVTIVMSAQDVGQSGVESITYSATGTQTVPETTVPGSNAMVVITAEGETTVNVSATDVAGNVTTRDPIVVRIDTGAPTVSAAANPASSTTEYVNQDVVVTVSAADSDTGVAGITIDDVTTTIDPAAPSATADVTIMANGTNVVAFSAVDAAGNESADTITVLIDKLAPTVTATAVPASTGYVNEDVVVTLAATDAGESGVASITYSATGAQPILETTVPGASADGVTITVDGSTTITATAVDAAGNVSAAVAQVVRIDTTGPVVTCPVAPTGWFNTNQTITCTVADPGSGLAAGTPTSIDLTTSVAAGTQDANASATAPVGQTSVCDALGNCSPVGPVTGFQIDRVNPTATITTPADGQVFQLGASATPSFTCADLAGGSGVASCVASPTTINTSAVGRQTFSVTATDVAGNSSVTTTTFDVAYQICLEYDPTQAKNAGSNYTITVVICDANGTNVAGGNTSVVAVSLDMSGNPPPPNDSGGANQGAAFRRTGGANRRFTYNLDTTGLSSGVHTIDFVVDGGTFVYSAPFAIS